MEMGFCCFVAKNFTSQSTIMMVLFEPIAVKLKR